MALKFLNDGYFAGKVGIGIQSPLELLHLESTEPLIRLDDTNSGLHYIFGQDGDGFKFTTNNSTYGKYTFDANVGIGVTSPSAKLEISQGAGGTAQNVINSGEVAFRFSTKVENTTTNTVVFRQGIYHNNTENATIAFYRGGSSVGGFMTFQTQNGNERMRIEAGGNVGIGTTSPGAKLEVAGGADAIARVLGTTTAARLDLQTNSYHKFIQIIESDGRFRLYNQTTSLEQLTVLNSGNVGIGTDSPSEKLDVRDGTITSRDSGNVNYAELDRFAGLTLKGNGASAKYISTPNTDDLGFKTNNAEKMRITSAGNVGIGTTSPDAKLDIEGDFESIYALKFTNTKGTGRVYGFRSHGVNGEDLSLYNGANRVQRWDENGNSIFDGSVGIGTDSPSQKLHVTGNLRVTGAYYDSNNSPGTANQVLVSTATGTDWVDGSGSSIIGGPYLPLTAGSGKSLTGTLYGTNTNWSGDGDYAGNLTLGTGASTQEAHLQIGQGRTGNGYSYIDLIGDATYTDYGFRVIRNNTGANTSSAIIHRGTGNLEIQATDSASILLRTNNTTALTLSNTQNATFAGDVNIDSALLSNQENTDVDTGTETIANVAIATYTAAFFDFVIKKTTNVRSGTVYACHDGTNVEFTETSTQDLGDTSDVTLSVDISGGNMRLRATTTSDDWSVKSLIRAI